MYFTLLTRTLKFSLLTSSPPMIAPYSTLLKLMPMPSQHSSTLCNISAERWRRVEYSIVTCCNYAAARAPFTGVYEKASRFTYLVYSESLAPPVVPPSPTPGGFLFGLSPPSLKWMGKGGEGRQACGKIPRTGTVSGAAVVSTRS
jgi:hypothetical protein